MNRLLALVLSLLTMPAAALTGPGRFELTVLDVGQGDATVVTSPSGCTAVFDGGPKGAGATVKAHLKARGITQVDYVFVSHYHADHIGGIDELEHGADAVRVGQAVDRGSTYASITFNEYATQYAGRRTTAVAGRTFSLCGEVTLAVVSANANAIRTTDENALSVAVKVTYGRFDALIGGDLETDPGNVEQSIAASVGEIEVYKVHHHGSRTSSGDAFLQVIRPTNAFISVGLNNVYMHPHPEALARLSAVGAQVWVTEDVAANVKRGAIGVTSVTGDRYDVKQGAVVKAFGSKGVDVTAPSAAQLVATVQGAHRIDLAWSGATDDVAVVDYRLEYTGDLQFWLPLATTTATEFSDVDLPVDTDLWYRVVARDGWGNEAPASNVVHGRTTDVEAPSVPLALVATAASPTRIALTWGAATDDVEVTGYEIVRDGALRGVAGVTRYDDAVGQGESHTYVVNAYDAAGNHSAASNAASAKTACAVSIPQKSWGVDSRYLYVKAVASDPSATLTTTVDGALLGAMIWSDAYQSFSIRRKLAAMPACVTVVASCGGVAVSCF